MLWKPENDSVPLDVSEKEDTLLPSVPPPVPASEAPPAAKPPVKAVEAVPVHKAPTAPIAKESRPSLFHSAPSVPVVQPKSIRRGEVAETAVQCILSAGTTFVGDIDTTDSVVIEGKLEGRLTAAEAVRITGQIHGDVEARCIDLVGGTVNGNLCAADALNLSSGGIVLGDLSAHEICLKSGTQVTGNIQGASVLMEPGVKLHGQLSIEE